MIFGDIEEFISEELYPYRWPIVIGMIVAFVAVLAIGYRQGWHGTLWSHKAATVIVGVPLLVLALVAGDYLLSPLFERSLACEASPIADAGAGSEECTHQAVVSADESGDAATTDVPAGTKPTTAPGGAPEPDARVVSQGEFSGADDFHFGEGTASIIETEPGVFTLRFEDFSVRNGPDLFVYLSPDASGYADGAIELGRLKATDGAFGYRLPDGLEPIDVGSAVIWCKQFAVQFAVAPLEAA